MNPITEEKLAFWKNLIEEKNQSGLTLKEFCQGKNITPPQYYYYHGIINGNKKERLLKQAETIKPIRIISSNSRETGVIRFIMPNSLQCVFPRDISAQEVKKILEAVMSC